MHKKNVVNKETRERLIVDIKHYFAVERGEDLGDLAASLILDFFIENLAPYAYNQGVYDAHRFMSEKIEDLLGIQQHSPYQSY